MAQKGIITAKEVGYGWIESRSKNDAYLNWININSENIISVGSRGFWYNIIIGNSIQLEVKRRRGNIDFCEETHFFENTEQAKLFAQNHFKQNA